MPLPGYEELSLCQVLSYLKEKKVPKRFWPERLELIDRIPHTGSGKVKKYLLREELERRNKQKRCKLEHPEQECRHMQECKHMQEGERIWNRYLEQDGAATPESPVQSSALT